MGEVGIGERLALEAEAAETTAVAVPQPQTESGRLRLAQSSGRPRASVFDGVARSEYQYHSAYSFGVENAGTE